MDEITVSTADPIGTISPLLYGHFIEHLGRCIYGGLWVGDDEDVDTVGGGLREDTVALLREVSPPVLRWPGGCFADTYHWEDGVGPREQRPRRPNHFWNQGRESVPEESNAFGTEEYMRLCRLLDAEPFLTVNVGTGSREEALNWVEYCNADTDTVYGRERASNGRERPHGVTFWEFGNEPWGCGGRFDSAGYAAEYRTYAHFVDAYRATDFMDESSDLELVASGHSDPDWTGAFVDALDHHRLVDHVSIHRFIGGVECGSDADFDREEYYRLFSQVAELANDVDRTAATVENRGSMADVGIVLSEWGIWHPLAKHHNSLEQENTVRDALAAASVLNELNERADVVTMANLAQAVNVLQCLVQTDERTAWPTPTFRVFELYEAHRGNVALRTRVETDVREIPDGPDVPLVAASSSRGDGLTYVTVVNRSYGDERAVRIDAPSGSISRASVEVLFADQPPDVHSSPGTRGTFAPAGRPVDPESGVATVELPASSVVGVTLRP